jgi:electron transfer flavoprotein beta subunit
MKFLVCIKQVPDVSSSVQTGRMVLNAYDASALEAVLVLSEGTDFEIDVVLVGPDSAKETIRKALAMGATRAAHILTNDDAQLDSGSISSILANYCRSGGYDVIACGKQSQDTDASLTGSMLAEHLQLPFVTNAVAVTMSLDSAGAVLTVTRQGDSGQEIFNLTTPCLITCSNDMNNPRIPSLKGIMGAKKKPIEVKEHTDLSPSKTRVVTIKEPPPRDGAQMMSGESDEQVGALVRALEEAGVL